MRWTVIFPVDSSSHSLRWQHVSQTFYDIIWAISATTSLIDFTWLHKFSVGMRQRDVCFCLCDMFVVVCGCTNIRYPNVISSVSARHKSGRAVAVILSVLIKYHWKRFYTTRNGKFRWRFVHLERHQQLSFWMDEFYLFCLSHLENDKWVCVQVYSRTHTFRIIKKMIHVDMPRAQSNPWNWFISIRNVSCLHTVPQQLQHHQRWQKMRSNVLHTDVVIYTIPMSLSRLKSVRNET